MSFIQQFFTSRDNNANAETFVGQEGRLWWDPVTNKIYSSDGETPGGIPLAGGGGGDPGGSNSQVQFNNSGSFGGSANLTFNRVTGALTAVSFAGDGSALSNITGANVVGAVTDAIYASSAVTAINAETVIANSQPNINSVGILTSLSVTGNVDANYFIGNGSQLTGITTSSSSIFNGTSNVDIATANGNVTITTAGTRTWTFSEGGALDVPKFGVYEEYGRVRGNGLQLRGDTNGGGSYTNIILPNNDDCVGNAVTVANEIGNVWIYANGNTWAFNSNGNLTLPNQSAITIDPEFGYTNIESRPNGAVRMGASTDTVTGVAYVEVAAPGYVGISTANIDSEYDSFWSFNPNGTISFPYQRLTGDASEYGGDFKVTSTANIAILANLDPTTADSGDDGYFVEIVAGPGANSTVEGTVSGHGGNVYIAAGSGGDTVDYANAGPGGTVYIQGGQTWNFTSPGGDIELTGGQGIYSGVSGNIRLLGGTGNAEFSSQTGVFSVAGNVMTGNYFVGDGGFLSNIQSSIQTSIADGNSSVAVDGVDGNVLITTNGGGGGVWTFDTNGALKFPEDTAYIGSAANTLTLHANDSEAIYISDISGGISAETNGNVTLIANVDGITNYAWTFDNTGKLTAPGPISAVGNATITYTPATAVGAGISINAANTQGGTGYADFLQATNTSDGATNPNKSFRLSSTGGLEVINSAYSATILSLTDAGGLSVPGPVSVAGKQAVNGPAFRAYISVGQTITSGSQQKVTFGSETFDTNSNFASSRFTPTVEGYYQFNATVRIDGPASTGECMIILYKNGAEYARGNNESGTEQGASFYSMQVSDIAYANGTGDYFEVYIQQTSGSNKNTTAGAPISYFSGCMIRGA
jgi:hypothetical protein